MKKVVTLANGERRTLTAPVLVAGLAAFKKQRSAEQARAYDAGLQAAKGRIANNAISAALLQSNRSSQLLNARAIDQLFDAPAPTGTNDLPLLDVLDGIVPAQPQSLDDVLDGIQKHTGPAQSLDNAIDGITPATKTQSIDKFIQEL